MALAGRGRKPMSEINVVPYIDVMLVLLIIFMVTAPLLTQGVKVDLPDADAPAIDPAELQNRPPLVLSVDRQGRLYLNQGERPEEPLEDAMIEARVAAAAQRFRSAGVRQRRSRRALWSRRRGDGVVAGGRRAKGRFFDRPREHPRCALRSPCPA